MIYGFCEFAAFNILVFPVKLFFTPSILVLDLKMVDASILINYFMYFGRSPAFLAVFTERPTWCRRRIWSIQSWGVPFQCEHHDNGHRHSCPKSKCHVTCNMSNTSICLCLHSRRINSRSVWLRVIPVNRDWGHCRPLSLISAVETAGPVISRSITSWKPWGFALASDMSTLTLFWALPGSTRISSASSSNALSPRTSGTTEVSSSTMMSAARSKN